MKAHRVRRLVTSCGMSALAICLSATLVGLTHLAAREPQIPAYDRDAWGGWIDADGDGMDTRQEVLFAESEIPPATNRNATVVLSGRWTDPYTGAVVTDPLRLDVDHVVPLAEAHASGGWAWTDEQRAAYANDLDDPQHLIAVTASVNRSKGAKDPAHWLPVVGVCRYLFDWMRVKRRWALTYDDAEAQAIVRELARCVT